MRPQNWNIVENIGFSAPQDHKGGFLLGWIELLRSVEVSTAQGGELKKIGDEKDRSIRKNRKETRLEIVSRELQRGFAHF